MITHMIHSSICSINAATILIISHNYSTHSRSCIHRMASVLRSVPRIAARARLVRAFAAEAEPGKFSLTFAAPHQVK